MFCKRVLAIAALVLCCFGSAGAAPPAAGDGAQKHFLWKVTGPKGVVYLFGTIHAGKAAFYPLPSVIEDSFQKADTLIEEVDTSDPSEAARIEQGLAAVGGYTNGDTITNHLSEATRSHLAAYVKKGGLPEAAVGSMRPWLVSLLVMQLEIERGGGSTRPMVWTDISSKKRGTRTRQSAPWRTPPRNSGCSARCPRSFRTVCY